MARWVEREPSRPPGSSGKGEGVASRSWLIWIVVNDNNHLYNLGCRKI